MDKKLGENIKKLRCEYNIKQKELAEMVNITPTHLSQIESGQKYPSVPVILDIAKSLNVDPAAIVTNDDNYHAIQKILKKGKLTKLIYTLKELNSDLDNLS